MDRRGGLGDGAGTDLISDFATDWETTEDRVSFGSSVAHDQLWFSRSGNNLDIAIVGTIDRISIEDWYGANSSHVDKVVAGDGYVLLENEIQQLVDAMAAFTPPPSGQMTLSAQQEESLAPVLAAAWQPSQ